MSEGAWRKRLCAAASVCHWWSVTGQSGRLIADAPNSFHDEDRAAAALFAAHAAVAFAAARERIQFQEALASRDVIGQAKGILMTQSHITADEAFDMLRRASQRLNRKLVSIAQDIVDKNAE